MENNGSNELKDHAVVSPEEWISVRTAFLVKEKEFTKLRDELSRQRRALPWERVVKPYVFDGPHGKETFADLFGPHSQLIVYHFMFAPDWEEGCPHCSFWADHFDGMQAHLGQRDVSFTAISRAPLAKIEGFKKRMGWGFKWVSSSNNDFNYDLYISFTPEQLRSGKAFYNYRYEAMEDEDREGVSAFYKDESGEIFHTYSSYARGIDLLNGTYNFLDLAPKGRDEDGPEGPQYWVRHHDRYNERYDD